jgi:hypothetical protein
VRLRAPFIGGAAIAVAIALVWFFRPQPEPSVAPEFTAPRDLTDPSSPSVVSAAPSALVPPAAASSEERVANAVPTPERSPLPGEAPATPMAQIIADRQQNMIIQNNTGNGGVPPALVDGEREFAAEPIDATWALGAEAKLLGTFARIPGLQLIDLQVHCRSTMCRLQMTQPPTSRGQDGQLPFNILRDEVGMTPRWMMAVVEGPGPPGPPQPGAAPRPMKSIAYLWREGFAPQRDTGAASDAN